MSAKTEKLLNDLFVEMGPARQVHDAARKLAGITRDDLVHFINDIRVLYAPHLQYTEGNMLFAMTLFLMGAYLGRNKAVANLPRQ